MMNIFYGLLNRCSLPCYISLTPLISGENQSRPAPEDGGSREDFRLPYYTAGFE